MEEDSSCKECASVGQSLTLSYAPCFVKPNKGHLENSVTSGNPQVAET